MQGVARLQFTFMANGAMTQQVVGRGARSGNEKWKKQLTFN
jgi:hypothetical protein